MVRADIGGMDCVVGRERGSGLQKGRYGFNGGTFCVPIHGLLRLHTGSTRDRGFRNSREAPDESPFTGCLGHRPYLRMTWGEAVGGLRNAGIRRWRRKL